MRSEFRYTAYAQEVIFGPGALAQLSDAVIVYGWQRLMICTTPSLRKNGTLTKIEQALGNRLVAICEAVSPHVQASEVADALKVAERSRVDAMIGLGGGSPIGMAKAVSVNLEALRAGVEVLPARYPTEQPTVPNIAIPTTYAGSEMTPIYGVSIPQSDGSTRKVTYRDAKVTPKLVVYDPVLTLDLPASVTAGTGINALAHCIEAIYSTTRNPVSTALALLGIKYISRSLLRCTQQSDDLEARTEMMTGAHLAGQCVATAALGLHHGTCHVLGGTAGVPHGVANAIILPHAIRYNQGVAGIAQAAEAAGVHESALADWVYDLVGQMGLPQRLRDAGVSEHMPPKLAELMLKSTAVQQNPKSVTYDDALALLQAAW
jgi:alcohol dehydrogenase class IV